MTRVRQEESEGSGGNWMPNLINWLIGTIMMQIWFAVGALMGIFGDW